MKAGQVRTVSLGRRWTLALQAMIPDREMTDWRSQPQLHGQDLGGRDHERVGEDQVDGVLAGKPAASGHAGHAFARELNQRSRQARELGFKVRRSCLSVNRPHRRSRRTVWSFSPASD